MKIGLKMLSVLFILSVLVLPNRISEMTPSAFGYFPLEALLLGLILLVRGSMGLIFRGLISWLITAVIILKFADMGTYQAFDRPFNPVLDTHFWADGMNFLSGTLGQMSAYLVVLVLVGLILGIIFLVYAALGSIQALLIARPKGSSAGLLAGLVVWGGLAIGGWPGASTPFYNLLTLHVRSTLSSMADLDTFNKVVDSDPYVNVPNDALFEKLKGKDVLVLFVESYGRTVLDKPDYAAHIRPLLAQSTTQLAAHNILVRSAYLTSPTYGGISWLAHGTLLSGLWINSQTRYDRLVMSKRQALNRLFQRAGWRTVTLQPAHTMAWPQGAYFGYDQIYAASDLGYRGETFNWITMPDQYTLSALQVRERKAEPRPPVMAEIALISSHAPWTPLPQLIEWNQVGDGSIFSQQARIGDTPEVVWQNTEQIKAQYRKSIEYSLATIVSYALTYADDNLVMLVLGDHQPMPFVTGESESHEVLVHLISRDPGVMAAVQSWNWTVGMLPANDAPVWGMDTLRDRFIAAFSRE